MTYLELLTYARHGVKAEIEDWANKQQIARDNDAMVSACQGKIDELEIKLEDLDALEEIHNK